MTRLRATAYYRVMQTLRDVGPSKLWPSEQDCIRDAADALLFCHDLETDPEADYALAAVEALTVLLVDAERWTKERAMELRGDIWGCGPWNLQGALAA